MTFLNLWAQHTCPFFGHLTLLQLKGSQSLVSSQPVEFKDIIGFFLSEHDQVHLNFASHYERTISTEIVGTAE